MYSVIVVLLLACTTLLAAPSPNHGPQPRPAPFQGGVVSGPSDKPWVPGSSPGAGPDPYGVLGLRGCGGFPDYFGFVDEVIIDPLGYDCGYPGYGFGYPGYGFGYPGYGFGYPGYGCL